MKNLYKVTCTKTAYVYTTSEEQAYRDYIQCNAIDETAILEAKLVASDNDKLNVADFIDITD